MEKAKIPSTSASKRFVLSICSKVCSDVGTLIVLKSKFQNIFYSFLGYTANALAGHASIIIFILKYLRLKTCLGLFHIFTTQTIKFLFLIMFPTHII
ncbi:MAG: hypothetical protein QG646_223 [Euryarchaeota archaeon]|nr:hypothetical protein [Euryarchaeota archaeon]